MQSGVVVAVGVERKPEVAVAFGVGRIHAEGGARFGESVIGVVGAVKEVGQLAVGFGETGHQARRFRKLVERFVEPLLAAQNGSKNEMQQSIARISGGAPAW